MYIASEGGCKDVQRNTYIYVYTAEEKRKRKKITHVHNSNGAEANFVKQGSQ